MEHRAKTYIVLLALAAAPFPAQAEPLPIFSDYPALDTQRWMASHGWKNSAQQNCEWRKEALSGNEGNLLITLSDKGQKVSEYSCGEIQSKQRYSYGMYSVRMRAAAGSGLNTAFFTYIGKQQKSPHDEIDFEFLGKNPKKVQLNYYVGGKSQGEKMIELGYDASKEMHEYSFVWEPDRIRWYIDDKQVHETAKGAPIPSHPSKVFVSLWAGTDKVKGWLGHFDYQQDVTAEFNDIAYTPLPAQ